MYFYDYHMHSTYSSDGNNSIDEICKKAISVGLKEIAITDHFEPSKYNTKYLYYKPADYFIDILKAKSKHKAQLNIKSAVELGQPHIYPQSSTTLLESYPYDYVLGSAHKMVDDTDFSELHYHEHNKLSYCFQYLDELKSLAKWNQFDCIGHLDLIKRYAALYNVKINLLDLKDQLKEILMIVIENGKGIEINTSGLRQHSQKCLPDLDTLCFYRQLGGEILTIGSDAHYSRHVGAGIRAGIEIAKDAGFEFMTVFNQRKPFMISLYEKSHRYSLA